MPIIEATLKRTCEMLHAESLEEVKVPPGKYLLRRVLIRSSGLHEWYVIKGTQVGMACAAWEQWIVNHDDESAKIIITVDGFPKPPRN